MGTPVNSPVRACCRGDAGSSMLSADDRLARWPRTPDPCVVRRFRLRLCLPQPDHEDSLMSTRRWFTNQRIAFWTMVGTWAAVIGVFVVVYLQNRATRQLNSQQLFFQFYNQWESDGMQERRARLAADLLNNSTPENIDDSPLVFL